MTNFAYPLNFSIIVSTLFLFTFYSCNNDDDSPLCNTEGIEMTLSVTKQNVSCSDLNLNWELDFGVDFKVVIEGICNATCDEHVIQYYKRALIKNASGIDTIQGASGSYTYVSCNNTSSFSQTLNTPIGEFQEYSVGDTIQYELYNFGICRAIEDYTPPGSVCADELEPLDLPLAFDFYILREEDFDCD